MSSENKDSTNNPPPVQPTQPDNYYQRKKNWISGWDNDTVLGLGVAAATTIASIAAFPIIKNAWENFVNRPPQLPANPPPPPPVEEIIPPTPPTAPVPNGHSGQSTDQSTEQTGQSNDQKQEEEDGLFHDSELRRRQKLMGQRPKGSRYDSPFGKDIGGL